MRSRTLSLALLSVGALLVSVAVASAAPVELTVRIEGQNRTLFEGPILSDGHEIRAAGDSAIRRCDGTDGGADPTPGPTPTAAGVDAMALASQDFGARWFPGMSDYYVERWGPDGESFTANGGAGAFWGLLVNDVFSPVGGCRRRVVAGDEVLWAYDAFNLSKTFLSLGADADPDARIAYVDVGEQLDLIVRKRVYSGVLGVPPGVQPAAGVPVGLVTTDPATGFQSVGATQATSDGDGDAAVSFSSPGWKRLKASADGAHIRSNRLDVCVRPPGGDCGPLPTDAVVRIPPLIDLGDGDEPQQQPGPPPPPGDGAPATPAAAAAKVRPKAKKPKAKRAKRCGKNRRAVKRKGRTRCVKKAGRREQRRSFLAATDTQTQAALDRSVRFLQDAQNQDGGFGGTVGQPSDPGFTAWAAYALAAAGINPQDQSRPGGVDVHTYLTQNTAGLFQTTDFDRVALVALASGTSPHQFGEVDPVGTILARQLPDGSFPQVEGGGGWVNSTIWSIFPLSAIDDPEAAGAVQAAADWLLTQQRPDGSWPSYSPGSASDADMTGAAIQALNAAGRHDTEAEALAFEYLRLAQGEDGGFAALPGGESNSATTAWVIQGMWSADVDPRSWQTAAGHDPLSFLASLQRADGSIGYTAASDTNSLWMTAQVGPALAGHAYPLPAVARKVSAPERAAPEAAPFGQAERDSRRGRGGKQLARGDGVIAGGGGRGAPLFSAPQPQSAGSTPRGARGLQPASAAPDAKPEVSAQRASGGDGARIRVRTGDGGGGGSEVEGMLVGSRRAPVAPGLFGASRGGEPEPALMIGLLALLGAAGAAGIGRERRSTA